MHNFILKGKNVGNIIYKMRKGEIDTIKRERERKVILKEKGLLRDNLWAI